MTGIKVTDNLYVSPQISVDIVEDLKNEGFTQIICNRPDGESSDQTPFAIIAAKAEELGIKIVHQPITAPTLNAENAIKFEETIAKEGKTFAYCRSGTRCITLWSIAQLEAGAAPSEIVAKGSECGYDLTGVASRY